MRWFVLVLIVLQVVYSFQPTLALKVNPILAAFIIGISCSALLAFFQRHAPHPAFTSISQWQAPAMASQYLLRTGIILFACKVDSTLLLQTDPLLFAKLLILVMVVFSSAYLLGTYVFTLPKAQTLLISAGFSFCGTSAMFATYALQQRQLAATARITSQQSPATLAGPFSQSLVLVMLCGVIMLLGYHLLLAMAWLSPEQMAWLIGSTAPEVSQTVAAAAQLGSVAALAVTIKLARVCLLVPYLLLLSQQQSTGTSVQIPWFVVGFVLVLLLQLLWPFPDVLRQWGGWLAENCLMLAMLLTGWHCRWTELRQCSGRLLLFAFTVMSLLVSMAWLMM